MGQRKADENSALSFTDWTCLHEDTDDGNVSHQTSARVDVMHGAPHRSVMVAPQAPRVLHPSARRSLTSS